MRRVLSRAAFFLVNIHSSTNTMYIHNDEWASEQSTPCNTFVVRLKVVAYWEQLQPSLLSPVYWEQLQPCLLRTNNYSPVYWARYVENSYSLVYWEQLQPDSKPLVYSEQLQPDCFMLVLIFPFLQHFIQYQPFSNGQRKERTRLIGKGVCPFNCWLL